MPERKNSENTVVYDESEWLASEAVVDAAICLHEARGFPEVPVEKRWILIQAVMADPELTEFLFQDGFCAFH